MCNKIRFSFLIPSIFVFLFKSKLKKRRSFKHYVFSEIFYITIRNLMFYREREESANF